MGEKESCVTQLITGDGEFCTVDLDNFIKSVDMHRCGLSYAVVAIMGPQSSGKSTLLNHLFSTNFVVTDLLSQTTKGIWIAKALDIDPLTLVMDLEGTDGIERGEDDTTFEKQSALFALAVADVVLINMWGRDIGREYAANRPLLETVFQAMTHLFTPRKTTLLFVIRDKTKTPFEILEPLLRDSIKRTWEDVCKPHAYKDTPLSEFFNVEFIALSSYEWEPELFLDDVAQLKKRFFHSISPEGHAGDRQGVVPASGFSLSAKQIWKVIKESKELDLPTHKVMVATVRCQQIADEKLRLLASDEDWLALEQAVRTGIIPGFGESLSSILKRYLSEYDTEVTYFEEGVRNAKRQYLESEALQLVHPAYLTMLEHLRSNAFEIFKTRLENILDKGEGFASFVRKCQLSSMLGFDQGCSDAEVEQATWDASKTREKLNHDIQAHSALVHNQKLSEVIAEHERRLSTAITKPEESLFEVGGTDTWVSIRQLLKRETGLVVSDFSSGEVNQMVNKLKEYARNLVEKKAGEESGEDLIYMEDRFSTVFNHDREACIEMTLRRRSKSESKGCISAQ